MSRSFLQQRNINLVPVSDQTSIVWNTGGDGTDVNTWEQLYSLIQRVEVPMIISLDREPGDPFFVIPEGDWDFNNATFVSKTSALQQLFISDGAVITNFNGVDGVTLVFGNSAPVFVDPTAGGIFKVYRSNILMAGTATIFELTDSTPFTIQLTQSTVAQAGAGPFVTLNGVVSLSIQLLEGSSIPTNLIVGAVGTTFSYSHEGATVFPIPAQAGMLGTIVNDPFQGIVGGSGPTTLRPASPTLGTMYFDTTLATPIPIWWDGAAWVDATGTPV